ncbi:hypothetical protein RYX36_007064, partial [Vicia faba]
VRDWIRGLIHKLANRYLYQALSHLPPLPGNLVGTDLEGSANRSIRNDAEAYIKRIKILFYGHPLPPRDEWDDWLSNVSANSSVTIQKCIQMEFDGTGDLFFYPGGFSHSIEFASSRTCTIYATNIVNSIIKEIRKQAMIWHQISGGVERAVILGCNLIINEFVDVEPTKYRKYQTLGTTRGRVRNRNKEKREPLK